MFVNVTDRDNVTCAQCHNIWFDQNLQEGVCLDDDEIAAMGYDYIIMQNDYNFQDTDRIYIKDNFTSTCDGI